MFDRVIYTSATGVLSAALQGLIVWLVVNGLAIPMAVWLCYGAATLLVQFGKTDRRRWIWVLALVVCPWLVMVRDWAHDDMEIWLEIVFYWTVFVTFAWIVFD